jgi:hypothetical protein
MAFWKMKSAGGFQRASCTLFFGHQFYGLSITLQSFARQYPAAIVPCTRSVYHLQSARL